MGNKTTVGTTGASGSFALVLVFFAGQAGLEMTPEVAVAFTGVVIAAVGWLKEVIE